MRKHFQKLKAICILGILLVGGGNFMFGQTDVPHNPFVYAVDNKLYYQDEEYFIKACNYLVNIRLGENDQVYVCPHSNYLSNNQLLQTENPLEAEKLLYAHFKLMKEMGFNTVRIMNADIEPRHQTGQLNIHLYLRNGNPTTNSDPVPRTSAPDNPDDELYRYYEKYCYLFNGSEPTGIIYLINAMETVLKAAEYYNIKVIWVLGTENRAYYDGQFHYKSLLQHINPADSFSWINVKYGEALAYIGNVFKNNSTLLAYELYHENQSFADSETSGDEPINQASVGDAVRLVVNYLKVVDSNHLTTTGLFGENTFFNLGVAPFYFTDFLNFHFYEYSQDIFDAYDKGTSVNRYQYYLSRTLDEYPWIIGEHGIETQTAHWSELNETDLIANETDQRTLISNVLDFSSQCGSSGYAYWQFANERGWQNHGVLKISDSPIPVVVPVSDVPVDCYFAYKQIVNPPESSVFNTFEMNDAGCDFDQELYYNIHRDIDMPFFHQTWEGYVKTSADVAVADAIVKIHVAGKDYYTFTNSLGHFIYETPTYFQGATISVSKYGYNVSVKSNIVTISDPNFIIDPIQLSTKNEYIKNLYVAANTTMIIDKPTNYNGSAIVETGATLIVRDTVSFGSGTQLILKSGSKLILEDKAALTAIHQRWRGVVAYNTLNNTIAIVSSGNTSISKAEFAIRTMYDVTVNLNGTDFYNNMCDISMKLNDAQMLFRNCDFIQTPDVIDPCMDSPSCDYCVDLYECGQVKFTNCHFDDQRLSSVHVNKSGICAKNVDKLEVLPNPLMGAQRSSFNNLLYGIKAIANGGGELIVKNTDFKAARGIYMYHYMGFLPKTITNNTFEVLDFPKTSDKDIGNPGGEEPDEFECQAYGVYVDNTSSAYQIEGNIFKGEDGNADYRYGLIANDNGVSSNRFYRNKFENLENAVQSINNNKNLSTGIGLQILCNNFNDTRTDIYVTTDNNTLYGISTLQGSTSSPAGNLFSNGAVCNYNNEMLPLTYFARINSDPYWNPREWPGSVNDAEQVILHLVNYSWLSNACPDNTQKLPKPIDELRLQKESAEDLETAITYMLDDIVDGGNTGLTISSVLHSDDNSAWLTYYELMSKSPYLSDTVLKEVAKKEQGLTVPMIRDILVANPQGIKNKDLQQLLKDRNNQLPDYMITQIESGLGIISPKENLEIQKAEQRVIYEESLKTLVAYYQSVADSLPYAEDSIVSLLCERNEKEYMDVLADYFFTKSDFTSASDIVNRILSVCTLSQIEKDQYSELKDFYQFYNNLLAFYKGDLSNLNAMHIAELKEYENRQGLAAVKATALLIINNASDYIEPVYKPQPVLEDRLFKQNISINNNPYFSVYPNPAKEYIYVEYMLTEQIGALQIAISDVSGKMYLQKELIHLQDIVILKTVDLPEGSYNCSLYNGNKLVYNSKIIISK
ncbi:MAG: hypothetical protein PHE56_04770 [Bacteroidales bacterium]|nr:hypothetical protein [Bacteroidales bacterium]